MRSLALITLALIAPVAARAQQPARPIEEARLRVGALSLAPRISLTNMGVETNVFNSADNPQKDFTFTTSPGLDLWLRTQRGLLSLGGQAELVYYNKFPSERSVNGFGRAQYEYRFNRIKPFILFEAVNTRERPGYEIDIRARRFEHSLRAGLDWRVAGKSSLELSARRAEVDYAGDAVFGGRPLRQGLNRALEAVDVTWRQQLTPLTTWVVRGSAERERFEFEDQRNSDSVRAMTGFELGRFALIRGTALFGYRHLVGTDGGTLPDFTGVTADINVAYSAPSQTRLGLAVKRDIEYSFEISSPYYVHTGWTATLTQRIIGPWDVQLLGGRDGLAYRGAGVVDENRKDRVDRVGGGIGYQLGDATRVGFEVVSFQRQSDAPGRDYKTVRAGLSVSYGF